MKNNEDISNLGNSLKSLILSAGLGTRLRPLTDHIPKPLATICNVPLFDAAVRLCVNAGSRELAVNTHHLSEIMSQHALASYQTLGVTSLHVSHEAPEILGTGGALVGIAKWWGANPLLVYNGDILSDLPLNDLVARHRSTESLVTIAVRHEPPQDGGRSVWISQNGYVRYICKKSELPRDVDPDALLEAGFACAYVANAGLRDFLPQSPVFYDVIAAFNAAILAGNTISAALYDGFWADVGNPKSLWDTNLKVQAFSDLRKAKILGQRSNCMPHKFPGVFIDDTSVVSPSAVISPGAKIINSVVLDGAHIRADQEISNSIVGLGLDHSFL